MALSNEDILNAIAEMSVMDVVALVEAMEEKFGVSAAAAVAATGSSSGGSRSGRAGDVARALARLAAFPATAAASADAVLLALAGSAAPGSSVGASEQPRASSQAPAPAFPSARRSLEPASLLCLRCPEAAARSGTLATAPASGATEPGEDVGAGAGAGPAAARPDSCDAASECCEAAHDCVSACLAPSRRGALQRMVATASMPALFRARTAVDACSARCLTSSSASLHENAIR